ncbi:MAG: protein kinase [Alphaproteobacteria bacterium]|nr:protein kinase [Alphaproteobacteria bacterium]
MADAKADANQDDLRGTLPVGTRLRNYQLISVLGQGGFGITYYARDAILGREVAIKEYLPTTLALREETMVVPRSTQLAADFVWGRERFLEEARTLATLEGAPAVVRVYDFLEANGTAYMVMGLVRGETLDERLKREGHLSPAVVGRVLGRLLDGLEAVHKAGFLHRDIKPANIILDAKNSPTLIDFGASRASMADRTAAMTAIFTPRYAAAEQLTSEKQGPWTDIYGLSATIYHAISGNPPPSSLERALNDTYVPLSRVRPQGYSSNLLHGIDAGLTVRPRERPQSLAQWREIIAGGDTALGEETVLLPAKVAPPATATPAVGPVLERNRTISPAMRAPAATPAVLPPPPATSTVSAAAASSERPASKRWRLYVAAAVLGLAVAVGGYSIHLWMAPSAGGESGNRSAENVARDKAQAEAKAKAEALAKTEAEAKQKADLEAKQRAEAAAQQAEAEAKARADAEAKQKAEADAAKAKAEAEARKAEAQAQAQAEAKKKADAEAEQKQLDSAAQKVAAEAAETALKLAATDRMHIQVALTSLGFDTHGADGTFGPRTREMIQGWQQAHGQPATGFVTAAQQQALLAEAAPALAKYDEEQKKAAEAAARARAAASSSPPSHATGSGVSCQDSSGRRIEFANAMSCPYGLTQVR